MLHAAAVGSDAGGVAHLTSTDEVFSNPQDSYTRLLLSSVPRLAGQTIPAVEAGTA